MKAALDTAAAAGSKAAAGLSLAATAAARFAPWLILLDIQKKNIDVLFKVGEQAATVTEAEKVLTEEIDKQTTAASALVTEWDKLHGAQLDADKEALGAMEAIKALGETFKENGPKIKGNSAAARENRIAMREAAREAAEAADAYIENGGSAEGAARLIEEFKRAAIRATGATGNAKKAVQALANELFNLPPKKTVEVKVKVSGMGQLGRAITDVQRLTGESFFAHGGISGAASGGQRGGLHWVGEQGPELVRLPYGSTVYPSGQSQAMAQQGGGGGDVRVVVEDRTAGGIRARLIDERLKAGVRSDLVRAAYP